MELKNTILCGDVLEKIKEIPDNYVNCVVTSPPYYGLRNYGIDGQIGLEQTPEEYVNKMVEVFREVRRVLASDGVCWLNLGDSYYNYRPGRGQALNKQTFSKTSQDLPQECARRGNKLVGFKEKDLLMIPARCAIALQADGWTLRSDIIWNKPNPMPESVFDRPTKSYEHIFLLTKSPKYFYNGDAIREPAKDWGTRDRSKGKYTSGDVPISGGKHGGLKNANFAERGKNRRDVWTIQTSSYRGAHFATMPATIPEFCIKAGCPDGGIVFDPFSGSGTTAMVAKALGCNYLCIELNPKYIEMAEKRIAEGYKKKVEKTIKK